MSKRVRSAGWVTVSGTEYEVKQEVDETSGMVLGLIVREKDSRQSAHIHFYFDVNQGLFGSHVKIKSDLYGDMRVTAWDIDHIKEELQEQGYFSFLD